MPDEIVVTLYTEGFSRDFELPANIKLGQLYQRLLTVLLRMSEPIFGQWQMLLLETDDGILADDDATLYDYGIHTGCRLRITQGD